MLANGKPLLVAARKHGYAIGAFNFSNLEQLQAIVEAAEAEKSPAFISTSEGAIEYATMPQLVAMAHTAAKATRVPIVLHLDHGKDPDVVKLAIRSGYTSVMFDGSSRPYGQNVTLTKQLATLAHRRHIPLEAELGVLKGIEDSVSADVNVLTDPAQVREFVRTTGCDSIAVAIGTSHGVHKFKGMAHLDFQRLREIAAQVNIPIVLHGASGVLPNLVAEATAYGAEFGPAHGVDDQSILNAIKLGVAKVNIDSDLRLAFIDAVRKVIQTSPESFDPRQILGPARDLMTQVVRQKMRLFGSSGRA
jgi:fructose-bisphosphate aldolase class II